MFRSVLVTGGTGSFGQAFARKALDIGCERVCVLSRSEHKQAEMRAAFNDDARLRFFIGDVRDKDRLVLAMRGVEAVVHAAALKVVPACEADPSEAIKTNILGADNVVHAALVAGVRRVMAISTDKAAAPNTLYGCTKLCAERLFIAANNYAGARPTRFSCVRYGNVIGSSGSVIPIFQAMRDAGATSLPVTHKDMTRFFWSLGEAVEFTLSSMGMMAGGEVFIPKIKARRIVDVAREVAPDLPHKIVGIRPGEKLHEALIASDEVRYTLELPDRYVIRPVDPVWNYQHLKGAKSVPDGFSYGSDSAMLAPSTEHQRQGAA